MDFRALSSERRLLWAFVTGQEPIEAAKRGRWWIIKLEGDYDFRKDLLGTVNCIHGCEHTCTPLKRWESARCINHILYN